MVCLGNEQRSFYITIIQVYAPTNNAEEAEVEWFYEYLQDLLELTPKKRCPFHYRGLECKSRKYQEILGVTGKFGLGVQNEGGQTKANRALPRECTSHSKHPLPTTQEKALDTDITRWSIPKSD